MSQETSTCYRHSGNEAWVKCQRCERPICSDCMKTASVGFHCPECVKTSGQKVIRGIPVSRPVVTIGLIIVNALAFLVTTDETRELFGLIEGPVLSRFGNGVLGVADGEWYRIISSGFMHANILHIGLNMYMLWILGQMFERRFGPIRFAGAYFASLVGGSLLALVTTQPNAITVGASGAVFGLLGALFLLELSHGVGVTQTQLGPLLLINLVFTFRPGISIGGHIGGLILGLIAGAVYLYGDRWVKNEYAQTAIVVATGVIAFGAAIVVAG